MSSILEESETQVLTPDPSLAKPVKYISKLSKPDEKLATFIEPALEDLIIPKYVPTPTMPSIDSSDRKAFLDRIKQLETYRGSMNIVMYCVIIRMMI
jgi:hypothetical protein